MGVRAMLGWSKTVGRGRQGTAVCISSERFRGSSRSASSTGRQLWVQVAPIADMLGVMPKVIQIRDVPDEVHEALADAAEAQGLSLTKYMLRELEHLATRAQIVHNNARVIRETQAKLQGQVDRNAILDAIREGRGD